MKTDDKMNKNNEVSKYEQINKKLQDEIDIKSNEIKDDQKLESDLHNMSQQLQLELL